MMRRMRFTASGVLLAGLLAGIAQSAGVAQRGSPSSDIVGVWRVTAIDITDATGSRTLKPQPGLFIFTEQHYSALWTDETGPRRDFATRWKPTDRESLNRYRVVFANSGSYTTERGMVTTRPIIAKVPEFVGGRLVYGWKVTGDLLSLTHTDEYTHDNVQAPWVGKEKLTLTLRRLE